MTIHRGLAIAFVMTLGFGASPLMHSTYSAPQSAPHAAPTETAPAPTSNQKERRTNEQGDEARSTIGSSAPSPTSATTSPISQSESRLATSQGSGWYWLQIVIAASLGGAVAKVLDIFVLTPATWKAERRRWLREQRLSAYAEVARDVLSLRLSGGQEPDNPFQAYAVASRAVLLANNDALATRIDQFIVALDKFYELSSEQDKQVEAEQRYENLQRDGRKLVSELRAALVEE